MEAVVDAALKEREGAVRRQRAAEQALAAERDICAQLRVQLAAHDASVRLVPSPPGDPLFGLADTLLQNTWFKKDSYQVVGTVAVHLIENPRLSTAYEAYKAAISVGGVMNGNETQVFHGCAEEAMDAANPASIVRTGFLKKYWKSSAGDWQRFGPGFYFGLCRHRKRTSTRCLR